MKMEDRKPRESRFGTESREARLARLREQAPTLGSNRRLRLYAIFGAVLMLLTVVAFYMTLRIYRAILEETDEDAYIEVDQAPEVVKTEAEKALERILREEAEAEAAYAQQLERLKTVDLLAETPEAESGEPGENEEQRLDQPDKEPDNPAQ